MRFLLAISILFGVAGYVRGAITPTAGAAPRATPTAREATPDAEVTALRAQLQVMRDYDQRLLATVYWSLGGILTLAGLLVGLGWYANFRVYERDRASLAREVRTEAQSELLRIRERLDRESAEEYARLAGELRRVSQNAAQSVREEVMKTIDGFRKDLRRLEYLHLQAEGETWRSRDVQVNALRSYIPMLELALSLNNQYWIADCLDHIHTALGDLLAGNGGPRPDAELIRRISEVLGKVPIEFDVSVSAIKSRLKSLREN